MRARTSTDTTVQGARLNGYDRSGSQARRIRPFSEHSDATLLSCAPKHVNALKTHAFDSGRRSIWRAVVYDKNLNRRQARPQRADQVFDVLSFVVCRRDNEVHPGI